MNFTYAGEHLPLELPPEGLTALQHHNLWRYCHTNAPVAPYPYLFGEAIWRLEDALLRQIRNITLAHLCKHSIREKRSKRSR